MKDFLLFFSFISNIILAIALFFKGAINQVIAEWIKSIISDRRKKKENLRKVHTLVKHLGV